MLRYLWQEFSKTATRFHNEAQGQRLRRATLGTEYQDQTNPKGVLQSVSISNVSFTFRDGDGKVSRME